jgi:GT2 family glycosyltransferase
MMRKAVFYELEGYNEQYALALRDIDLCLQALSKDYLIVWSPYVELYHHESKTRGYEDNEINQKRFKGEVERLNKNGRPSWRGETSITIRTRLCLLRISASISKRCRGQSG